MGLFLHQYHTVFIVVALQYILKLERERVISYVGW